MRLSTRIRCILTVSHCLFVSAIAGAVHAQPADPQTAAAAQALYDQATEEIEAKQYASACHKLEEVRG